MRTPLARIALLLALPSLAASLPAQAVVEATPSPRITVTVTRVARVAADRAVLYAAVEGTAETAADAAARADLKAQAIVTALRALGLPVERPLPYGVSGVPVMNSYPGMPQQPQVAARMVVRTPLTNLQQAAGAAAAAHGAGAAAAPITSFESSKADSVRRSLYAEAITAARQEAEALAQAMNVRLGRPTEASVTMGPQGPQFNYLNLFGRGFDGGSQNPPDVTVTATVVIRYPISMLP
jgi:uncharacterized protein YggE